MKNLAIKNIDWNCAAYIHLKPACNDDYSVIDLSQDVMRGKASLYAVFEDEMHVASMVLRLDDNELVVVALGGRSITGALIQNLSSFWDELAIKNKANKIRAHVSKKGMAKLMERVGGQLSEYVYKKGVCHGR